MTVPFNYIPAGNGVRVPLFYAEMDNSQASIFSQSVRSLLIGQKNTVSGTTYGNALFNVPYIVSSVSQAKTLFGIGSILTRMYTLFRQSNPTGEVWCMAVADASSGTAATGTITIASSTGGGFYPNSNPTYILNLYIAGQLIQIPTLATDTSATIATNIATAINANYDLPVSATATLSVVTLTAEWKGLTGNDITVLDSFKGSAGGESLPYYLTLTYSGMSGGTVNPSLAPIISAMGDDPYDFVVHPYTDAISLSIFATEYGDAAGRWSWLRQIYGHCYTALRGTLSALVTVGSGLNDPHHTIAAIDVDCPHPAWEYAAAYAGRNAAYITADPARPTQTGPLNGLLPPRAGKRFLFNDRNSLLNYGIATSKVVSGVLQIERAITTYQKNTFGASDLSYLDSEMLHTSAYVLRYLQNAINSKYGRHKLANDGTRFSAGNAVVTPSVIRGELISAYDSLVYLGIVENREAFIKYLIVERDTINTNRLNILFPPDYINQLRVFAVLNQFRLQYPAITS